jgi:hypothetical protein
MRRLSVLVIAALLTSVSAQAAETERRERLVLKDAKNSIHFEVTRIVRTSDDRDHEIALVLDRGYGKVILERDHSFAKQLVIHRITDPKRETYIESRFGQPFTSTNRADTLEEARQHPELVDVPVTMTLSTNGGEWTGLETNWREWGELREVRRRVRASLSFSLLEAIERMRDSVFATRVGDGFYLLVAKYALYDPPERAPSKLILESAIPDCDFDKSFGYPCSEKQLKRAAASAKENVRPRFY